VHLAHAVPVVVAIPFPIGVEPRGVVAALRDDPGLGRRLLGLEAAPLGRRRLHARHHLVWAMTCRFDSGPNDP
jgi:hypothetical protein